MKPKNQVILASSSKYRSQQLTQLSLDFICVSPNIEEEQAEGELIANMVERLSTEKALAVQYQHPQSVIIGSDQSASLEGKALGKPFTEKTAIEQLKMCSGKTVTFHTGLCVLAPNHCISSTVDTEVVFRELSDKQVTSYIRREQPLNCAGSFKCEGLGIALFQTIKSDDPSALIGLPLISLTQALYKLGIDVLETQ